MTPGQTILLIDDDPACAALVRRVLGVDGAIVRTASGIDDPGIEDDPTPSVIVVRTALSDAHRLELLDALRARPSLAGVPILVVVRPGDAPPLRGFVEIDAVDFLREPIDGEELRFRCHLAVRGRATIAALQAVASTDPLTGLPGRTTFVQGVERALERARRTQVGFGILVVELSGLGRVNECFGHQQGDRYVAAVAATLHRSLRGPSGEGRRRGRDFIARLASSEFGIVAAEVDEERAVGAIVARLQGVVQAVTEGHCHANIGVRMVGPADAGAAELLRDATASLGSARRSGRGRWAIFDPSMREQLRAQMELEVALREALRAPRESEGLVVHYQPIMALATGEVAGFEALVRWIRPDHGPVSPDVFIGIAERSGLIGELGSFVMNEVLGVLETWHRRWPGRSLPSIAVNASRLELVAEGYARGVVARLDRRRLPHELLEIEVTESAVMHDRHAVLPVLNELRAAGVRVSMDDFGVGESSLAALRGLTIDDVQIDRSFVARLGDARGESAVVHAIVSLAENLGIGVVAEGIESPDQLVQLQAMDCTYGQGWLFGAAMPAEEATAFVANGRSRADAA